MSWLNPFNRKSDWSNLGKVPDSIIRHSAVLDEHVPAASAPSEPDPVVHRSVSDISKYIVNDGQDIGLPSQKGVFTYRNEKWVLDPTRLMIAVDDVSFITLDKIYEKFTNQLAEYKGQLASARMHLLVLGAVNAGMILWLYIGKKI